MTWVVTDTVLEEDVGKDQYFTVDYPKDTSKNTEWSGMALVAVNHNDIYTTEDGNLAVEYTETNVKLTNKSDAIWLAQSPVKVQLDITSEQPAVGFIQPPIADLTEAPTAEDHNKLLGVMREFKMIKKS